MNYLPGSTLRGALAAKYLRLGGASADKDFEDLFLTNSASFPNLLPVDNPETLSRILPLTAMSCKRMPGFRRLGGHGVQDHLVTTYSRIGLNSHAAKKNGSTCPECINDLQPYSGFWNGDTENPSVFESTMFYGRHTGIDRDTGTVAPSIFFTTEAISDFRKDSISEAFRPQCLSGGIFLRDEHLRILRPLIQEGSLFAGAERRRGFGELILSIAEAPQATFDLETWDKSFKEKLKNLSGQEVDPDIYFSLKLESHAILVDKFLRSSSDTPLSFPHAEPLLKVAKAQKIRGWQSRWGLPKPDDLGLSMGSVFLFRYRDKDLKDLKGYLNRLLIEGIGLRREEGFGRISVCDPLHTLEVV
jgi:CRISPR-associated Csx10 family RAMP protein